MVWRVSLMTLIILNLILDNYYGLAAVVHSHSHSHGGHKERESDGAYSPRDHIHFSENGEHSNEFDHEAILGSHKEADEYDNLPPEEAKKRLEILLRKVDLTGDRKINRKELKAWILRSFKMLSEEDAAERFEDADENSDGFIEWKEYLSDTYGVDSSEYSIDFGEDNEHLIKDDKLMWKAADTNGDEKLNGEEWILFSNPEEHPQMLPIILEQTLRDKDSDKDGSISFQEYIGEKGAEYSKETLIEMKVKFDEQLDKNRNGKLDGSEILSWIVPSNEEIAQEEVDHLFAHSDDDHDDILTFEEILDHHDIFVGSEATDYGDHLHNIQHFDDEL